MLQVIVFLIAAAIVLIGAGGVIFARHPVHAALFLIQTLFGVAVLFLVISENLRVEPIIGQRQLAWFTGASIFGLLIAIIYSVDGATGFESSRAALDRLGVDGEPLPDVNQLAESIFTDFVFAFEVTGLLLTVAVVGAVVMARKISGELQPLPDLPERRLSPAADAADPTDEADAVVEAEEA